MRTTTRGKQKSDRSPQSIGVPACRPNGALDVSRRRLALVVHFLIALEAGKCAAATCTLDGKTISSSVTNSVQCNINGILTVSAPNGALTNDVTGVLNVNDTLINSGSLINDGLITNNGLITSTGRITGAGMLNNAGIFVVASGKADIAESQNLSGGTLTGGTWEVGSTGGSKAMLGKGGAALVIGGGDITTNDAAIELLGANSTFTQLSGLRTNEGSLTIGDHIFTSASLYNTGTLSVAAGGTIDIAKSRNLSGGTLTGGTWVVDSTGGQAAKLIVGGGNITTNDATIELLGADSSFAQLNGLRVNEGSLTIGSGASLDSKLSLYNTGTLTVASGSTVDIAASKNLSGGISGGGSAGKGSSGETLTGGTWVVDSTGGQAAKLTVGSGEIATNDATVELLGASSSFAQLNGLKTNEGSLTIGSGASFTTAGLINTGTLVSGSGGTLVVDGKLINKGSITVAGTITRGDTTTGKITTGGQASFTNSGKLAITSGGSVTDLTNFTQISGVTTLSGGVLSAQSVSFAGGVLTGSGTVDPASPIQIGPGSIVQPTGTLTLQGSTEFDGELAIGIAGPDDFGDLDELGAIDFGAGSSIDFSFDPGFDMVAPSYQFQFLEASNDITGLQNLTFAYNGLGDYTPQEVLDCASGGCDYSLLLTRNANSVPEPGTLPLAALGVLGLSLSAALRRRKQRGW